MSKSELKIKTRERGCIWRERKGAQGLKRRNDHADDAAEEILSITKLLSFLLSFCKFRGL